MRAFLTMVYRQTRRFLRSKSRIVGMILNPIIWIVFFGIGWSRIFKGPMEIFGGVDYLTFLAPGIFAMTIFNQSFISGVSVIWDKEFGFLKEVLVAPTSRKESIAGRIFGDSIVATCQGILILLLTFSIAKLDIFGILPSILIGFMLALAFTSFGVSIATKMESMEGFHAIVGILMLPLIFLSGAIYPIDAMPEWMRIIAYANPMTYAVDGARLYLVGTSKFPILIDWVILVLIDIVLLGVAMIAFERVKLG
ncbi:ABC transporter [Nanoarchaeota archaeon]|nr:MAG: ABC transporter [Nanoarchaeota archaeon]